MTDLTNPTYYKDLSPEPIEVVEDWQLDFHLGCVLKYISRAGWKEGTTELDDLRKARWYLDRKIKNLVAEEMEKAVEVDDTPPLVEPSLMDKMPLWFQNIAK